MHPALRRSCRAFLSSAICCAAINCWLVAPAGAATPAEVLAKASALAGPRVIRTAEISFVARISAPVSAPQMEEMVAAQEAVFRQMIEKLADRPEVRQRYEDALRDNRRNTAEQMKANAQRVVSGMYYIGGPQFGGDRYVEFRVSRSGDKTWQAPISFVLRRLSAGDQTSIQFDSSTRTAIIGKSLVSAGIEDPHFLGRLQGLAEHAITATAADATSATDAAYQFAFDEGQTGDEDTVYVNVLNQQGDVATRVARVLIDQKRDHVCPTIEEYDASGKVRRSWRSEAYFRDRTSGLLFPARCLMSVATGEADTDIKTIQFEISEPETRFNLPYDPKRFAVHIPKGMVVVDATGPAHQTLESRCDVALTIDDIESLGSNPCVKVPVPPLSSVPFNQAAGNGRSSLSALILINVIVVAGIVVAIVRGRGKKNVPCWLLAGSMASSAVCGCSTPVPETPRLETSLNAAPPQLDLGQIVGNGQVVQSKIALTNNRSTGAVSVQLSAGCGCTTIGSPEVVLNPGEQKDVPFSLATFGRVGPFRTAIRAAWSDTQNPDDSGTLRIPIVAYFTKTVFAIPSRVFVTPTENGQLTGLVVISAPPAEWPSLEVSGSIPAVSVQEMGRDRLSDTEERRRFQITKDQDSLADCAVVVLMPGQSHPLLSVPLLSGSGNTGIQVKQAEADSTVSKVGQ